MRRYKIVACTLLTLSIFSFVLAAPVAIQEVREACADAVDDGDNVIIQSWKRAEDSEPLLAQQPSSSPSSSGECNHRRCPHQAGLTSWNPEGEAKLIQPGSSTETLPASSSNVKTVKWAPTMEVKLPSGLIYNQMLPPDKPETSTETQSASSSDAKSAGWVPKEVKLPSGLIYSEMVPPSTEPHPESESMSILSKLVEGAKTWLGKG